MPTYEYRCPKGHTFEVFHRMSDPPPEACEACGGKPLEKVLYPAAIHFKGSGFYSTDYGRAKRRDAKEGEGAPSEKKDGSGDKSDKSEKPEKKKPAEA